MQIITVEVTPFQQNARILVDIPAGSSSGPESSVTIVDPGGDIERLLRPIEQNKFVVSKILLTHAHIDHAGGVANLLIALNQLQPGKAVSLFGHPAEREWRQSIPVQARIFGLSPAEYAPCPEPDVYLNDGDEFTVGNNAGKVLFTPGHSPGHIAVYFAAEKLVIAGDALFAGSIGRTDLAGGDHELLISSIREKLLTLPDETRVLSGHGPETTIGRERRTNPFLK